jgi:undecaprenyl phosphate-alpha-L-ara4N flippase subunit ArnE
MIWISVTLSALAQVFLKQGLNGLKRKSVPTSRTVLQLALGVAQQWWIWLWAFSFIIATTLWLLGLQKLQLSYAYPLLSIGYILVNFLSVIVFRERVDGMRWIAVAIISAGVVLIANS